MTSHELATTNQNADVMPYSPEAQLDMASKVAKALIGVVTKKPKPVIVNGEIYLEFEDWQVVAQMFHVAVKTHAEPVEMHGVKGFKGYADLIDVRTGVIVGGSESYCMQDEERWGDRPMFQLNSMAQTRAGAKALRNRLSWVVMLAGYKTTPAEEMTGTEKPRVDESKSPYWCREHKTLWFKKGNMRGYAHQIKDQNGAVIGWCNMPPVKPSASALTPEEKAKVERDIEILYDAPEEQSAVVAKEATKPSAPSTDIPPSHTVDGIASLMNWCIAHGTTYTPSWVSKTLGIKSAREITDVKKAVNDIKAITGWDD